MATAHSSKKTGTIFIEEPCRAASPRRRDTIELAVKPDTGAGDPERDGVAVGVAPPPARGMDEIPRNCEPGLYVVAGFHREADHVPVPVGTVETVRA